MYIYIYIHDMYIYIYNICIYDIGMCIYIYMCTYAGYIRWKSLGYFLGI